MRWDTFTETLGNTRWWGIAAPEWLLAGAAALAAFTAMTLALRVARSRLGSLARHTRTPLDDALTEMLASTQRGVIALASLLIGLGLLDLPERWSQRVGQLWFVVLVLQAALWGNRLVQIGLRRQEERHRASSGLPMSAAATLIAWGLRTLLWAVALLAVLSNLGVNITAFVASLGVGGIAVALAAQNVLSDLFASVSIAIDKPFEVGDFIIFGSAMGTVEHVGIKSTRIRALGGEQVVLSNTELLKQTISNHKRLRERRAVFGFGLSYDTPTDVLETVPALVRQLVEQSPRLRFDRAHFMRFGESSLDFEVVFFVREPDFNVFMDEQQRVLLGLARELQQRGVGFAFPTRVVRVQGGGETLAVPDPAHAPLR